MQQKNNKARVLIVDDTPSNIQVLKDLLQQDYLVSAAINGPKAISLAIKMSPDIILLDIMMPEMDGFDVCRALKQHPIA